MFDECQNGQICPKMLAHLSSILKKNNVIHFGVCSINYIVLFCLEAVLLKRKESDSPDLESAGLRGWERVVNKHEYGTSIVIKGTESINDRYV